MNKQIIFFLIVISVFVSLTAFKNQPSLGTNVKSEFLTKYKEMNAKMTSISSDFVQYRHMEIMNEPIKSSGKFYYKKNDLMKWDQLTPSPYYFIVNGDRVVKFDGVKRKELSVNNPQVSYFKSFIMGTVDGTLFENTQFESEFTKTNQYVKVVLSPLDKQMKKRISAIELLFGLVDLSLQRLTMFEIGGDKMIIEFTGQEFNTINDDTVFE